MQLDKKYRPSMGVFHLLLNCTNVTKSRKASHIEKQKQCHFWSLLLPRHLAGLHINLKKFLKKVYL